MSRLQVEGLTKNGTSSRNLLADKVRILNQVVMDAELAGFRKVGIAVAPSKSCFT